MPKKKSEDSPPLPKSVPHKRIQTAEGWKRSQLKMLKSSSKPASKT